MEKISEVLNGLSIRSANRPLKREQQDAKERLALKLANARRIIGLGPKHDHMNFENFERRRQPEAYDAAKTFLETRRTLVLHGPVGTGKTHLAVAIAGELVKEWGYVTGNYSTGMGGVVGFWTFADALRILRKTYQEGWNGMGEEWYLARWRTIPVLILDEVGQEGLEAPSEFTRRIGYDIIDGRYRNDDLPIVITTNKSPLTHELDEWITAAAVDRLFEMGDFVEMRKTGSYRLRR